MRAAQVPSLALGKNLMVATILGLRGDGVNCHLSYFLVIFPSLLTDFLTES